MPDQDTIDQRLALLVANRRRLEYLFQQRAKFGAYTPHYIVTDIEEAQAAIRNLKAELRVSGVPIEDEPNDHALPAAAVALSQLSPQQRRNRQAMLAKVKAIWIDGLLKQSLAEVVKIDLGLIDKPDAVDLPLNALFQELNHPARPLPAGSLCTMTGTRLSPSRAASPRGYPPLPSPASSVPTRWRRAT